MFYIFAFFMVWAGCNYLQEAKTVEAGIIMAFALGLCALGVWGDKNG